MRLDFPWTLALAAAAVAATALALVGGLAISGPLVHATWGHLVRDVALLAIVGVAYEAPLARVWPALLAAALLAPWGFVLVATDHTVYLGLSGVSHALLAAAVTFEIGRRRGAARAWAAAVGAVLAVKLAGEAALGPAFPVELGPGVVAVPVAHVVGALVGVASGWAGVRRELLHRAGREIDERDARGDRLVE